MYENRLRIEPGTSSPATGEYNFFARPGCLWGGLAIPCPRSYYTAAEPEICDGTEKGLQTVCEEDPRSCTDLSGIAFQEQLDKFFRGRYTEYIRVVLPNKQVGPRHHLTEVSANFGRASGYFRLSFRLMIMTTSVSRSSTTSQKS